MSEFEFPSFQQPSEDARALLARLYREIGVSAVAAALDIEPASETTRAAELREALEQVEKQVRAA